MAGWSLNGRGPGVRIQDSAARRKNEKQGGKELTYMVGSFLFLKTDRFESVYFDKNEPFIIP